MVVVEAIGGVDVLGVVGLVGCVGGGGALVGSLPPGVGKAPGLGLRCGQRRRIPSAALRAISCDWVGLLAAAMTLSVRSASLAPLVAWSLALASYWAWIVAMTSAMSARLAQSAISTIERP